MVLSTLINCKLLFRMPMIEADQTGHPLFMRRTPARLPAFFHLSAHGPIRRIGNDQGQHFKEGIGRRRPVSSLVHNPGKYVKARGPVSGSPRSFQHTVSFCRAGPRALVRRAPRAAADHPAIFFLPIRTQSAAAIRTVSQSAALQPSFSSVQVHSPFEQTKIAVFLLLNVSDLPHPAIPTQFIELM